MSYNTKYLLECSVSVSPYCNSWCVCPPLFSLIKFLNEVSKAGAALAVKLSGMNCVWPHLTWFPANVSVVTFQPGVIRAVQRRRKDRVQTERLSGQRCRHVFALSHPLPRRKHQDRFDHTPHAAVTKDESTCCFSSLGFPLLSRRGVETHVWEGLLPWKWNEEKRAEGGRRDHWRTLSGRSEEERCQAAARR